MRISDWSSDVCSSDLEAGPILPRRAIRADELVENLVDVHRQEIGPAVRTIVAAEAGLFVYAVGQGHGRVDTEQVERGDGAIGPSVRIARTNLDRLDEAAIDTPRQIPGIGPQPVVIFLRNDEQEIGREHVCTPVTNAHLVCRLLLEKKK